MSIAKVVMLACHVGFARAGAQCSESLGNCPAPRASLMQLKTLKQKQQLQTTFGSQLSSFQKFTDEMIAKYGKGDDPFVDETIQQAVKTVLDFIDTMFLSLKTYHDGDQTQATTCMQNGKTCEATHLPLESITAINTANSTANTHHKEFLTCMTERATACGTENTHCTRYDKYRQQTTAVMTGGFVLGNGLEPQYLPDCAGDGHFGPTYIKAPAEGSTAEKERLKDMEACLEKTNKWLNGENPPADPTSDDNVPAVVEQHDGLFPHYQNCDRTKDKCEDLHEKCELNQSQFEDSYCGYEMWWDSKCGAWKNCFDYQNTECSKPDGICANIANNVLGRKADNETGMRLKCLLQVLFGEFDGTSFGARLPSADRAKALEDCTKKTYDMDYWNIDCGTGSGGVPPICAATCPADPGTTTFLTAYYVAFGLGPEAEKPHQEINGINKNIFPSRSACGMLDEHHHSYNCPTGGVAL